MAVALDADQEALVHFSFPIEKREDTDFINPVDGTPDVWIVGKATDGTIDSDRQIVDPAWSAVALKEWAATGGNIRMSHDPKRPVGKGHDVQVTTDGHYVKSLISDPLAKHFIRTGVLNDYSVGISMPHIKFGADMHLDPQGKATGGIITGRPDGLSKIAELSVVDRGSNFSSKFQITRKSAGGGDDFGFCGEMIGDRDEITKAAPPALLAKVGGTDLLTKSADLAEAQAPAPSTVDISSFEMPQDLSVTFTPDDMMRVMQAKFVSRHYDELAAGAVVEAEAAVYKRDIDTATRRRLAADGKALPNLSYPIETAGDLGNAAILARSGHGDVAAARRLIARRARELGVANPLDESDDTTKSVTDMTVSVDTTVADGKVEALTAAIGKAADAPAEQAEAVPDVTKDPEPNLVKKAKKKPKKLPPWLNKPDDDAKGDDDSDDSASKVCKSFLDHTWIGTDATDSDDVECSKCHTTPAQAAGVAGTHDMSPAPVKELQTSDGPACTKDATPASASGAVGESMKPVPAHREPDGAAAESFEADAGMEGKAVKYAADLAPDPEVAALLRFKMTGADEDLGRLHDLTCPAYHPEMAAKYHPYADMGALIDAGAWQRKTLHAAAGPLESAMKMQEMWQAALLLKTADPADLNDWRLTLHKAFRDANPGPGSFPTPGCMSPGGYNRPVLTAGRAANGTDYAGPNSAPQVATSPPDANSFDRPPLSAGHQSPSPSHMKWDSGQYPSETGTPTQLTYAQMQKESARQALVRMHDHLGRQFPEVCPMNTVAVDGTEGRPLRGNQPEGHPVPAAVGKGAVEITWSEGVTYQGQPAAALKATPEEADMFADAEIYKSFKKMRKKLGKKVLSGSMTVDEARAKLGRQFAQKGAEEPAQDVQKAAALQASLERLADDPQYKGRVTVLPPGRAPEPAAPVAAAFDPEVIKAAVAEATSELKDLLVKQQETFATKLAEQQKVIDAIADQPDPSTASFSGLAFQPQTIKSRRPAAVPDQAEYAARAQAMIRRNLTTTYETHSDPYVREAAAKSLASMGVGTHAEAS